MKNGHRRIQDDLRCQLPHEKRIRHQGERPATSPPAVLKRRTKSFEERTFRLRKCVIQ